MPVLLHTLFYYNFNTIDGLMFENNCLPIFKRKLGIFNYKELKRI